MGTPSHARLGLDYIILLAFLTIKSTKTYLGICEKIWPPKERFGVLSCHHDGDV